MTNKDSILKAYICPYCGKPTEYVSSTEVYGGRDFGMVYRCKPCKAWVGVHNKTSKRALGRLANKELRDWKIRAHDAFDQLWKRKMKKDKVSKSKARNAGYDWISKELNIPREYTHIGMFDVEQCKQVVILCQPFAEQRALNFKFD